MPFGSSCNGGNGRPADGPPDGQVRGRGGRGFGEAGQHPRDGQADACACRR